MITYKDNQDNQSDTTSGNTQEMQKKYAELEILEKYKIIVGTATKILKEAILLQKKFQRVMQ